MKSKHSIQPTHDEKRTGLSRRELLAAGLALPGSAGLSALFSSPAELAAQSAAAKLPELDIVEWSYFWTGVNRVDLGSGPVVNGQQMYVEYQIPAKVKYPYPVVLVHGGGGQGTDWMSTPDGRRGWAHILLEQGFMVYVVDRPGHGRSPYHPDLQNGWPGPATLEPISSRFTPMRAQAAAGRGGPGGGAGKGKGGPGGGRGGYDNAGMHNQWPGTGAVGTPELDQLVAAEGGAYTPGKGTGPMTQTEVWQRNGVEMVRKIGVPAVIMTHSAGGPFGMYVAEAEPKLVRALIINEGAGAGAFSQGARWGAIGLPMAYDPPVSDPAELKTMQMQPTPEDAAQGAQPYLIQAEPARKLKNWKDIDVAVYTAEASFVTINPGIVAYFKQAGVRASEIRLHELGIHGNGHVMMGEKNNRETLRPIVDWLLKLDTKNAPKRRPGPSKSGDSTAMKLADEGHFWVGFERKPVQNGTTLAGTTYVQYLKPAKKRSQYPVILVHGGAGQGTHYMGIMGLAGWAHYWVQAGYDTYVIDRPGHGRAVYHPDVYGEIVPVFGYSSVTGDIKRGAVEPNKRWIGTTGDIGDEVVDQFQAGQNSIPRDMAVFKKYYESGAGELLDKIGPSIIMAHSMGGPWPYVAATARPGKVKAILDVEGASPLQAPWSVAAASPGLKGVPIICVTAERSGRNPAQFMETLKSGGCTVEALNLKDKGILGNSHFMMFENNRKQVFDAIRSTLESRVKI